VADLPRITVITPSLNQGRFLGQTIESVLCQEYPNLEYFVIDGGSTDGTLDTLGEYDGRLHWISEPDRGQSHAINKGLRMATGDIVAYLNSDDLYEPGALLKVGQFFARQPETAWLTGRCRIIDPDGWEIRRWITLIKNLCLRVGSYRALQVLDYVSQPATFWHRTILERVGLFDETLRYTMDYDYSLRVGQQFELTVLDEYLASFRVHPASKGGTSFAAQFEEDLSTAKRYVSSPMLIALHSISNRLVVLLYSFLIAGER
jgi:glycosyltransferase involved in cell wall biosynthesis